MTVYAYDVPEHAEREREIQAIKYDYTCCKERRAALISELAEIEQTLEELVAEAAGYGVDLY